MRLRFLLFLLLLMPAVSWSAIPVYKNDTLTFIPIYLARSNFLDSATLTWTVDANGRMTPNVIGGASSNAQPPSATLTNLSTITTNHLSFSNDLVTSTILWVDRAHPNATATGVRGKPNLPWNNVSNAIWAAQSGDTVWIRGRYTNTLYTNSATAVGAGIHCLAKTNVTIRGDGGATIYGAEYGNHMYINRCDNLVIDGVIFEGGKTNLQNNFNADTLNAVLVIWGTNRNITIQNCGFAHIFQHGVCGGGVGMDALCYDTNTVVRNNRFYDLGTTNHASLAIDGAAIANLGCNAKIVGNDFRWVARAIEHQGTAPAGQRLDGWQVTDNTIDEVFGDYAIFTAPPVSNIFASNTSQMVIRGNVIRGTATRRDFLGISIRFGEQIAITGNTIRNCYNGVEVRATAYSISKVDVSRNIITDMNAGGFGRGVWMIDEGGAGVLTGVRVAHNQIQRIYNGGIVAWGGSHITVEHNDVVDAGRESAEPPIDFWFDEGELTNNYVLFNRVWTEDSVTATIGIRVHGSYVGTVVHGNDVRGYATHVSFGGTRGTVDTWAHQNTRGAFSVGGTLSLTNLVVTNRVIQKIQALAYTGTTNVIIDLSQGNIFALTATANTKFWPTNGPGAGWSQQAVVYVDMDGTGGYSFYKDDVTTETNYTSLAFTNTANAKNTMWITSDRTGTNFQFLINPDFRK